MDAVDVLVWIDRVDDGAKRDVGRQGHLDDDAGHGRIGVEALEFVAERVRRDVRSDLDQPAVHANLLTGPQDLLQIDCRRCVGADEHDRESRRVAPPFLEPCEVFGQSGAYFGRDRAAGEKARAGRRRRASVSVLDHACSGSCD